jgi:asparaginyl-tRNA synthetase
MQIKQILKLEKEQKKISASGWVISNRGNKNILFITINDGSSFSNLQVVVKKLINFDQISKLRVGAVIKFVGDLKLTPTASQPLELVATECSFMDNSDESFPLQKKEISLEKLRSIPHLRHRTTLFRAVTRVRSTISFAIHEYFRNQDYTYVAAPIITSNDGEGAGDSFYVKTKSKNEFFGSEVTLGVTGQLHAEALSMGMGKVYTFAPTFRAENSHTKRHAAEF